MTTVKKTVSVILSIIMVLSAFCFSAYAEDSGCNAISVSQGYSRLTDQFTVKKASSANMKYAYYSPVKGEDDTVKYPVVVYVHGLFHGWTDSSFLKSGLTYWCCSEIQSLFEQGGAHLIMPKIPETSITAAQTKNVYKVINEYINEHIDNVDMSQILIMGGSAGGGLAWNLMVDYPEFFSAGVVLCATKVPSANEVKRVANLPIWEISAQTDPLVNYLANQKITWDRLSKNTRVPEKCRFTVFNNRVTLPDGSHPGISHFLAKTIGYNLCLISGGGVLPGCNTVDGNNNTVRLSLDDSIIQWFQAACR